MGKGGLTTGLAYGLASAKSGRITCTTLRITALKVIFHRELRNIRLFALHCIIGGL